MGLLIIATLHTRAPEFIEHNIFSFFLPKEDANSMSEKVNYING
jgi:hypothetical protein